MFIIPCRGFLIKNKGEKMKLTPIMNTMNNMRSVQNSNSRQSSIAFGDKNWDDAPPLTTEERLQKSELRVIELEAKLNAIEKARFLTVPCKTGFSEFFEAVSAILKKR